jgi:hypothetical protein
MQEHRNKPHQLFTTRRGGKAQTAFIQSKIDVNGCGLDAHYLTHHLQKHTWQDDRIRKFKRRRKVDKGRSVHIELSPNHAVLMHGASRALFSEFLKRPINARID